MSQLSINSFLLPSRQINDANYITFPRLHPEKKRELNYVAGIESQSAEEARRGSAFAIENIPTLEYEVYADAAVRNQSQPLDL